ncbi:MAG TPA: indolepyruvate ferredoxin oxidoreductase subunit alpha [Methanotrichaceae archaeon]|nr:indolepyruvate ferredoxin oxidoreductase subunit alpha [Methanotrichaceae archaeon]
MKHLMSGNEAIARGAYEAGVTVATGYPGTPSTEILENLSKEKSEVYCEWSPNEKVAFEVSAAASLAGCRSIVTMKHVGLNVAADPLMTLSYLGVVGSFVACVADDPGMHSSQNEQDTRQYARFAKVPIFEPSDSQEARDFMLMAMEVSEKCQTPAILRSTTRVSHSRSLVEIGERTSPRKKIGLEKNPPRFVPIPVWGRVMRRNVEDRLKLLTGASEASAANRIEWRSRSLGIVTASIAYQYVREVWPEASVLKLGFSYPFPDALIREFAKGVERVLVVEELDDILEQHIKALGISCQGREYVPGIGELSIDRLLASSAMMDGRVPEAQKPAEFSLPDRPPVLCPGCPHRGIFSALGKHDVVVAGDIGCYSLGAFKPLDRMDTVLCMGAGVSMAHGFDKAGEPKKIVGIVGDSTFFHSGITGLLDIGYNKGRSTIIVLDNRTTAMTGHQDNPGTGRTLMGEVTPVVSIEAIGRACGISRVETINPYDLEVTQRVISEELEADEPSLIISRAPCPLRERRRVGEMRKVEAEKCKSCKICLKLACPALEGGAQVPKISEYLCIGCGLCQQVCPAGAITAKGRAGNG